MHVYPARFRRDDSKAADSGSLYQTCAEWSYALEMARRLLAGGAFLYMAKEATEVKTETEIAASELDLIPLVLLNTVVWHTGKFRISWLALVISCIA